MTVNFVTRVRLWWQGLSPVFFKLRRWSAKGGYAILDQAIFSGGNFAANALLARWMLTKEYGAYGLAFSLLMIFYQFHRSFMLDPMGVLGPSLYSDRLRVYAFSQLKLHFVVMLPIGLAGGMAVSLFPGFLAKRGNLSLLSWETMSLCLPLLLLPWLLRRAFYILGDPLEAVGGSVVYSGITLSSLFVFRYLGWLNSRSAILPMAVAGLISGLLLMYRLGKPASLRAISFREVVVQNWRFARWMLLSSVFMVLAAQAQFFLAGRLLGLGEVGALKATQLVSQPMILVITAVNALALPVLSWEYTHGDRCAFYTKGRVLTVVLTLLAVVFDLVLFVFRFPIERLLFGGKFVLYADLLPLWGFLPLLAALSAGVWCFVQVRRELSILLVASLIWLIAAFGLGYVLIIESGIWGAAISAPLSYAVFVIAMLWLYRRSVIGGRLCVS